MEESFLVLRGTPATVDEERDPVVRGIGCSLAQGTEQISVELGYTRNLVIEDRRTVGDGTVSLAERTTVLPGRRAVGDGTVSLAERTTVLAARDVDG
jgi:hypothetical protein